MGAGVFAIAEGVSKMANADMMSQLLNAVETVFLVSVYIPLTMNYMNMLDADQEAYYRDTLAEIDTEANPDAPMDASRDQQKYNLDEANMTQQTGEINSQITTMETTVRSQGDFMQNVYDLEGPLTNLLNLSKSMIEFVY
jgi:hypothetical protein